MKQSRSGITFLLSILVLSHFCEVAEARRFFRRRPSFTQFRPNQGFVRRTFSNNGFQPQKNNVVINRDNTKALPGFSNLLQFKNQIVEKNSFGQVRALNIDRQGNLLGASEAATVRQLREFYLTNRDKFKGNDLAVVDRFLARNGGLSNGKFVIDLKNIALPDGTPKGRELEAACATLNFLLNTIQTNVKLRIPLQKCLTGTVELDLSPFFRGEALGILKAADATAQCTGKTRLDKLVSFAMDPANYYKLINVPKNEKELTNALGINEDKADARQQNLLLVGKNDKDGFESGVTHNLRVLDIQNSRRIPGSTCYTSYDVKDRPPTGEQAESRDATIKGVHFTEDAKERLCLGRNGMMQGFLVNAANGQILEEAPARIATGDSTAIGPAITAVAACLACHKDGFIGGGQQFNNPQKPYTDARNEIPNTDSGFRDRFGRTMTHRDFFTSNALYRQRAIADSNIFIQAQKDTGSFFAKPDGTSTPLIPDMIGKFNKNLTAVDAAKSLGISVQQAQAQLGGPNISRTKFEAQFCNMRVGVPSVLNESQTRDLLRREAIDFNTGGRSVTH